LIKEGEIVKNFDYEDYLMGAFIFVMIISFVAPLVTAMIIGYIFPDMSDVYCYRLGCAVWMVIASLRLIVGVKNEKNK
jgi:hypothetical protein